MKGIVVVFLIAVCYLATVSGKEVFLNSTALVNCTTQGNCWFLDAALWENETLPEANDDVIIADIVPGNSIFINTSISLANLTIRANFQLVILSSANVSIQNIVLNGGQLSLYEQAQVYGLNSSVFLNGSELHIDGRAFAQAGVHFFLDETSSTWTFNNGYLGIHSQRQVIRGRMNFATGTGFTSSAGVLEIINQTINFDISPIIYNASYLYSSVEFRQGFRGSLSANLTQSSVIVRSLQPVVLNSFFVDPDSTLSLEGIANCTLANQVIEGGLLISSTNVYSTDVIVFGVLVLGGQVTIKAIAAHFADVVCTVGYFGEDSNVTVNVEFLQIDNPFVSIDFPLARFNASDFAYFAGAITINGSIDVGGTMYVEDAGLFIYGDINVGFFNPLLPSPAYLTLDEADLNVVNLRIANFSTFTANMSQVTGNVTLHHNSSLHHYMSKFFGNFINYGYVDVHPHHPLQLGSYYQGSRGVLLSYVDLSNRSSGYLEISGTAEIEGTILYNVTEITDSKDEKQLLVVQTSNGVSGKFSGDAQEVSDTKQKGELLYTRNDVYLVFDKSSEKPASMWWVWFIVAAAIIAVVGLVVLLVKTLRKRKDYQAISM